MTADRHERDPWKTALIKSGCVDPRNGNPSLSALSRETGLHITTLTKLLNGLTRYPEQDTVMRIAKALDQPFSVIAEWIGLAWDESDPYVPPARASLLTARERRLVNELILTMVADRAEREER